VTRANRPSAAPERHGDRDVARNRRASFDYEIEERFEAGLVLQGSEVKALRERSADLSDAWCTVEAGEAFVRGLNIPVLPGSCCGHQPKRSRKLLLHAREIEALQRGIDREGMTAVALRIYFRNGRAKLELGLARGKRKIDKRQALKEREADREAQAAMARRGARRD
jgi:SsrA-binding protein